MHACVHGGGGGPRLTVFRVDAMRIILQRPFQLVVTIQRDWGTGKTRGGVKSGDERQHTEGEKEPRGREDECHTIFIAWRWGGRYIVVPIVVLHVGWEKEEDDEEGGGGGEGGRRTREKGEKRGGEKRRVPFTPPVASSRLGRSSVGVWEVVSCCVRWRMEDNCFV